MPFVLGHALSMKAIHGGQAKHEKLAAHKLAALLRGGRRPQAAVYPAARRAPRDLRRRRRPLRRTRAARRAHLQHTHRPYPRPAIGQTLASKANRAGVAARFLAPAVQQRIAVDRALIDPDARLLTTLARDRVQTAKTHEAPTVSRVRAIPGVGKIRALVLRDAIHAIPRFPRVPAFVASCRLVTWAKEAAGQRDGTAGKKLGQASLTGAGSAAAGLVLRNNPAGQKYLARRVQTQGTGKALPGLAHQWARAVYSLGKRDPACELDKWLHEYWRGAGAPAASLAVAGISRALTGGQPGEAASSTA